MPLALTAVQATPAVGAIHKVLIAQVRSLDEVDAPRQPTRAQFRNQPRVARKGVLARAIDTATELGVPVVMATAALHFAQTYNLTPTGPVMDAVTALDPHFALAFVGAVFGAWMFKD